MSEQVSRILREQYERMDDAGDIEISPAVLAAAAYAALDPEGVSPLLVQYAAVLELRQLARFVCRQRNDEEEAGAGQAQLFDGQLQARYPAYRNGEETYVKREHLTLSERQANIARLHNEGASKIKHARALKAETARLVASGVLLEAA